jgi:ADP-heptose:LPS heptosyltransferase
MKLYIFFYIKYFFYKITNLIVNIVFLKINKSKSNDLIIIKTDNIGDYVLFRNFLPEIRKDKRFKNSKITLVANETCKDIVNEFDIKYINHVVFINRKKFLYNLIYRIKLLIKLRSSNYHSLICPIYSRDFFICDWISNWIFSQKKISFAGDDSNQLQIQKKISNPWYDDLFEHRSKENIFEFENNKKLIEFFLKKKISIKKTFFNIKKKKLKFKNHICFFVDAGQVERKYSIENFSKIAIKLLERTNYKIIFLGQSKHNLNNISLNKNFFNLCEKTSLTDLVKIISKSKLLISNDSCAQHIAAATNTNCLVIYAGFHYGRFLPYPKNIYPKHNVIMHPKINFNLIKKNLLSYKDINNIKTQDILKKIASIINLK